MLFVQWLNDVMFGSVNAVQCMSNVKYQVGRFILFFIFY